VGQHDVRTGSKLTMAMRGRWLAVATVRIEVLGKLDMIALNDTHTAASISQIRPALRPLRSR
jgi:hypothetical protein